ncbi:MAG: hypothetical protein IJK87_10860, partial [Prevotella sp.]|nr:hypothetical protein [Prevotella sp.]
HCWPTSGASPGGGSPLRYAPGIHLPLAETTTHLTFRNCTSILNVGFYHFPKGARPIHAEAHPAGLRYVKLSIICHE